MGRSNFLVLLLIAVAQGYIPRSNDENERIVGGEDAPDKIAPYMAALTTGAYEFVCGAAIIQKFHLLTAAECTYRRECSGMLVLSGTTKPGPETNENRVLTCIPHPEWDREKHINDIAIVRILGQMTQNEWVQPVFLPRRDTLPGTEVLFSGWGSTEAGGDKVADLKLLRTKVISNDECQEMVGDQLKVGDGHICSFTKKEEGACNGDLGGPIINDYNEVVGVMSWNASCGSGLPDGFTRIFPYKQWIILTLS